MFKLSKLAGIVTAAVLALMWAAPAQAQATRTWISGVGDDANPCSRTAPCKTFPGAISKTAAGGEIDCLDPGGFGAVTITKSMTLDCGEGPGGAAGGILNSGVYGINVNCSVETTCIVKVRNLNIQGIQKTGSGGLSGIKFTTGAALIVEHVAIMGQGGSAGSNGGIDFQPSGAAKLIVLDTDIQYGLSEGILIKPGSGGSANATLVRVSSLGNGGSGLKLDVSNTSQTAGVVVTARDSNFSGNAGGVAVYSTSTTIPATAVITGSTISGNTSFGLVTNTAVGAKLTVGGSTISGNNLAIVQAGSSVISTFGDNYVAGNSANETFPSAPINKK